MAEFGNERKEVAAKNNAFVLLFVRPLLRKEKERASDSGDGAALGNEE